MNASPPTTARKLTGLTWAPEVPSDWAIKRGKFLFELQKRPVLPDDDIVTAFRDGQVTLRKNRRTDGFTNALKEAGYQRVHKGDLVIHAMDAFAGAVGVSDADGKCTPVYSCCTPKEGVSAEFYARMIRTMALSGFIESLAKGIRERSTDFRWREFAEQPLPVPPLEQQLSINTFLDRETGRIDRLIEKKTQFIELLKEKRAAVITHAVTKGFDPDAPTKDSGEAWIGEIPVHWEVKPLRAFFNFRNEKNDPVKTENILSLSIAHGVTPYTEEGRGGNKSKDDLTAYKIAHEGDIVLNSMNVIVGAVGRSKYYGAISPVYYALYPKNDDVYVPFFEKIFMNSGFQKGLLRFGKGILMKISGTGQMNTIRMKISQDDLRTVRFPVPPHEEQVEIARQIEHEVSRIDGLIAKTEHSIDLLREKRSALITAAVTGKIDVRFAA
jgi:type I restriction enzyme, S subunit